MMEQQSQFSDHNKQQYPPIHTVGISLLNINS